MLQVGSPPNRAATGCRTPLFLDPFLVGRTRHVVLEASVGARTHLTGSRLWSGTFQNKEEHELLALESVFACECEVWLHRARSSPTHLCRRKVPYASDRVLL